MATKIKKAVAVKKGAKAQVKKTQGAHSMFPCVDLRFEGNTSVIKPRQMRHGTLSYVQEAALFLFRERNVPRTPQPHLHWHLLDRSLHGRVSLNAQHVKVEFYIHHDEYLNGRDLADILSSEMESLGETLCEKDLEEEVARCY